MIMLREKAFVRATYADGVQQGLKPRFNLASFGTTEEAAEKLQIWSETRKKHTSAAKATLIPLALYRG
jgi:hypothetical protein